MCVEVMDLITDAGVCDHYVGSYKILQSNLDVTAVCTSGSHCSICLKGSLYQEFQWHSLPGIAAHPL